MNKNTTTTKIEYLSAFLDDEAGTFEKRRMLDETQKDNELQKKIAHYSLIGEAMRNENSCVTVKPNFLAGIHEKLEEEPAYQHVQVKGITSSATKPWFNPVAGMAIAASLAAVTVIAINMNTNNSPSTVQTLAASTTAIETDHSIQQKVASAATARAKVKPIESTVVLSEPDLAWRKRLKRYVNSHVKYASTSAIMPSVRAASYSSNY